MILEKPSIPSKKKREQQNSQIASILMFKGDFVTELSRRTQMTNITEAGYWVASNRTFPQRPLGVSRRWCQLSG